MPENAEPEIAESEIAVPSAFFLEHAARLRESASIGPTLDLACGRGRHALAASALGLRVVGLDRDAAALDALSELHRRQSRTGWGSLETLCVDLENSPLPPLERGSFGAVLVSRYLYRPLFAWIESLVAPGGLVLYETFTRDQKALGWGPRRDAFLLMPNELAGLFGELVVELYEEGPSKDERSPRTGRLLASRSR